MSETPVSKRVRARRRRAKPGTGGEGEALSRGTSKSCLSPGPRTESIFFPTCQVRVVRFYQSCSPPRLAVLLLLVLLLLQFFLDHVCINFHLHFRLANSSPSSLPTPFAKLFANFPAQCAPLDLNLGPSQLSVHRWTSTWDLPSSVCTAGPQPGTCPAQCAPLDLNLGPAQLSVHRWTSTGRLPSSVCTAGPQRPDRMPEDIPDSARRYAR